MTKWRVSALVVCLAGCATVPLPPPATPTPPAVVATQFSIDGRISAKRGTAGVAGAFSWNHDERGDTIDLSSPLGQTLARLEGDSREATVHLSDGRVESAATWTALTEKAFGVAIPVEGMASWIRGVPRAGGRYTIERDAAGRVSSLRQDGWEAVYAYADDAAQRPFRVTLQYPGDDPIEVRVVVDRWGR